MLRARVEEPLHHLGQLLRREWFRQSRFALGLDALLRKLVAQIENPRFGHALADETRQCAAADSRQDEFGYENLKILFGFGDRKRLVRLRCHVHVKSESL